MNNVSDLSKRHDFLEQNMSEDHERIFEFNRKMNSVERPLVIYHRSHKANRSQQNDFRSPESKLYQTHGQGFSVLTSVCHETPGLMTPRCIDSGWTPS